MSKHHPALIPSEKIESKIHIIRNRKIMFDKDLALLYGVQTKVLNQAVRRNIERFPEDFMFQLTKEEIKAISRSQIVTLKQGENMKYLPYVFTEQGVAMLSSVLKSRTAILVNVQIIRTFVKLKEMALSYKEILHKIEQMEGKYDKQFQVVFKAIKMLLDDKPKGDSGNKRWS